MVWAWFHFVHEGGTEKNSPWWEKESSVHALMSSRNASSKNERFFSWSCVVDPYAKPNVSVSRGW